MKKTLWLVCALPLIFLTIGFVWLSQSQKYPKVAAVSDEEADFEALMGKNSEVWQFVKTREDLENIDFYKKIFETNKFLWNETSHQLKIPRVIHFIWLGPKPFPRESVENVKSWMAHHPDWVFKFWTDRERPLPHPQMEIHFVSDFKFCELENCFYQSDNYAEKADVWRYEILMQEGGVYVDHDVKCLKSFEPLNSTYDFYCGLELPSQTTLSSSVHPTNNLIGTTARHPIMQECLVWLKDHWQQIADLYPGSDKEAIIDRISHRTFSAFSRAVRKKAAAAPLTMVFPAHYFNAPKEKLAIFARHEYAGTWFENESKFEKMARERLMLLSKKTNKILLFCGVVASIIFCGFVFLIVQVRQLRNLFQEKSKEKR